MNNHYIDKNGKIYGYKPDIEDFDNLVEMTDELFQEYREQRQGHKWTVNGWVEDIGLMKELEEQNRQQAIADLQSEKAQTLQQMQLEMLLGNTELAKEHALKVKELEAELLILQQEV